MEVIIINGPSGSGKSTLAKILLKHLKNGIILNTDNYYKTGLISYILSRAIPYYFDRKISFNYKFFKRDLQFILKNRFSNYFYNYNFRNKSIKKIYKETKKIRFVILEGIFVKETFKFLSSNECILIKLKTNKKLCMRRVIKRDSLERGKCKIQAKKDFLKAWELYYKNKNDSRNYLKRFNIKNNNDINYLLKNITKIMN